MAEEDASSMKHLPASTVRLISSTQVITSVYSVIKELIENSLDAEAKSIEIKLENYGLDKIELRDNGTGIKRSDTKWMAQPHYTSKITDHNDLDKLLTYGFRGEALGALAAVSDLVITTKTVEDDIGMAYTLDKTGQVISSKPSCLGEGTTVTANNLFKNLPVRKQYYSTIKKKKEELKKVEDIVMAFGIIHPHIRFWVRHNKDTIWQKSFQTNHRNVLLGILGINVVNSLQLDSITGEQGIVIETLLPRKESSSQFTSRTQNDRLYCFVNKRPVTVKQVDKLLKDYYAHGVKCENGRHPVGFISITVPTEGIDVNLDPNKRTVLLHDQEKVCETLEKILINIYGPLKANDEKISEVTPNSRVLDDTKDSSTASDSEADVYCKKAKQHAQYEMCDLEKIHVAPVRNDAPALDSARIMNDMDSVEASTSDTGVSTSVVFEEPSLKVCESNNNMIPSSEQAIPSECDNLSEPDIFADDFLDDWEPYIPTKKATTGMEVEAIHGENRASCLSDQNENCVDQNSSADKDQNAVPKETVECSNRDSVIPSIIVNHSLDELTIPEPGSETMKNISLHAEPSRPKDIIDPLPKNLPSDRNSESSSNSSTSIADRNWSTGRALGSSVEPVRLLTPAQVPPKNQMFLSPTGACITPSLESGHSKKTSKAGSSSSSSSKRKSLWENSANQSTLFDIVHNKPNKKPLSAFEIYVKENKQRVLTENPEFDDDDQSVIKILEDEWRTLSADDRFEFQAKEIKDRETFWKQSMHKKKPEIKERERSPGIDYHLVKRRKVEDENLAKPAWTYLSEKQIQFSLNDLRRKFRVGLRSQSTQSQRDNKQANKSEPVGDLKSVNLWACCRGSEIFVLNHCRVQEMITFHHLLQNHRILADVLVDPIELTKSAFTDNLMLWDTLCNLPCRMLPDKPWPMVIDDRLTQNGFIVHKLSGGSSCDEATFQITSITGCIPSFGFKDLKSILEVIVLSESSTIADCRPEKAINYLKGEAMRMATQLPKNLNREDVRTLIEEMNIVLPADINKCFHNKPFSQSMYDMSNIPLSQEPK